MLDRPDKPSAQPEPSDRIAPARTPNMCAESRDRRCWVTYMAHGSLLWGRLPVASSRVPADIDNSGSDSAPAAGQRRSALAALCPVVPEPFAAREPARKLSPTLPQIPN